MEKCPPMAKPIPDLDLSELSKYAPKRKEESVFDVTVNNISKRSSSSRLLLGTLGGWVTGVGVSRVGKVAAFGLGGGVILLHFACELGYVHVNWDKVREGVGRSQELMEQFVRFVKKNSCLSVGFIGGFFFARPKPVGAVVVADPEERPPLAPEPITQAKPPDPFKGTEEPATFLEHPPFLPPKPIPHSPKISPSSIPNPSPSVTTTKQVEPGYPNYGGYIYSIPGYSAFQPVSYPGVVQPSQAALSTEPPSSEFIPFPILSNKDSAPVVTTEEKPLTPTSKASEPPPPVTEKPKAQTDFEENFTPAVTSTKPATDETKNPISESKMSITSLTQGSGATVTIPTQHSKDAKKKPAERFSLKTSIPISKIDMKCVGNPSEVFQGVKPNFNPTSSNTKPESGPRVEIQSNIVIKSAPKESENNEPKENPPKVTNSISTLINAAEMINKTDSQFQQSLDVLNENSKDSPYHSQLSPATSRPFFSHNMDANKSSLINKPPDGTTNEQKNQILFIQNKNPTNQKMLVTIQQQNSQVMVQRSSFEPKNLQAPSRLSGQGKKCTEEILNDNGSSSKVVALKRLHQEDCDENDFENLITENQIYGNKIVVKEKSQGTLQEQDLKNKKTFEKSSQLESKNVVLQPNFLYVSNVQFPANLMMIKNNKSSNETSKANKTSMNETKPTDVITTTSSTDTSVKSTKPQTIAVSTEIHMYKSSNNVIQTTPNKTKPDIVFQTSSQKVIMNPQIVYQVPMVVDSDKKTNQTFVNKEYSKPPGQITNEFQKPYEQSKNNDKLFIACPYQMDSKLQPKIVITNIRSKTPKADEFSSLDLYEKKKRLRRMKYLTNRENKDSQKPEPKRNSDNLKDIITPDNMKDEIYKELTNTRERLDDDSTDADSDYDEDEMNEYNTIINSYGKNKTRERNENDKIEFLAGLNLASEKVYKEKELERMERTIKRDSIAAAYITAGRLDRIFHDNSPPVAPKPVKTSPSSERLVGNYRRDDEPILHQKQMFLSHLSLVQVTPKYREGYERVWREIIKERKRRNGTTETDQTKQPRLQTESAELDPDGQLQLLTEIKKCVNENNNLIKKRLDSFCEDGDSIRVLAEKNFSELNRLSKMADRSVKHFSGQDTRKRDLNPGFDSEAIQKAATKLEQPFRNYPKINIPNISKIISLKSIQDPTTMLTTQATSMDEPQNSAAGVTEMFNENTERVQDFGCQVEEPKPWPGIEALISHYKEFEIARKKEIADLHRRNTALRVDAAHITRLASRDAERARALLAERHNLASEETRVSQTLHRLYATIELVKNC
ncbi:unnamed protein product, partial [Iphiclides podalirius]